MFLAGFSVTKLLAVELPLDTRGFEPVEGGDIISEGVNLYVSSFDDDTFSPSNPSDIVILGSVTTLAYIDNDEENEDDDRLLYTCSYKGYHTESRTDQEYGRILIETPVELSGLASSGSVGFIRKSGGWEKKPTTSQPMLAGVTGTLSYTSLKTNRNVDLEIHGTYDGTPFTVTSNAEAEVYSDDMVTVGIMSGSEESTMHYSFSAVSFSRSDNSYEGFWRRIDDSLPEEWIEKYAMVRVIDNNDSDGDGIPDFSDLGWEQVLGVIATNSINLGDGQVWSNDLNTKVSFDPHELWLYGENLGWFYLPDQNDPDKIHLYIPDENLGWLWTNKDISPCYIRESDEEMVYFELVEGQVWYYDYSAESWFQPTY